MKIALVCDWLTNIGGAERVLLALHELYPSAPIYTSQYNKKGIDWFKNADVRTGWLQKFPSRLRRFLAPLRQKYFEELDLSEYDIIISVTGAEAKSVKFNPETTKHLCYCHVPTQYYWQMYDEYMKNPGFGILDPIARFGLKTSLKKLKKADYTAAQRPSQFITISEYSADLIWKYYKRKSKIINPPVAVENFSQGIVDKRENYYITTARQVTWKRLDLCIKACLKTNRKLLIIGEGPEHKKLQKLAGNSSLIKFLPHLSQEKLIPYLKTARGYLFPSIEPFGIAPVEALAAGCPVIALKKGGSLDYIKDGKNGVFFDKQTVSSLIEAMDNFEKITFDERTVKNSSLRFSEKRFKKEIQDVVAQIK